MTTKVISYTEARNNLTGVINDVLQNCMPIVISSRGKRVVVIPEDEYTSFVETDYLLRSPANAERLAESKRQAENGETSRISLSDLKKMCK